jgi:phosphate transport system protein
VRDSYHEQLDELTEGLVDMSVLVARAVQGATTSLLDCDLISANAVISGDAGVNDLYHHLDALAVRLLGQHQPVACDLRRIVTSLRMGSDLERAGDYAVHLAQVARRHYPRSALPPDLQETARSMGSCAVAITVKSGEVIRRQDLTLAQQLLDADDEMDALHARLSSTLLDVRHGFRPAEIVDIALVGRYYERLADHAVAIARAVGYLVTGRHAALAE